jgi:3-hydroxybutyryl-CoA dehydrogenase
LPAVAVLGLGTMGHGIAQTFAVAGHPVRCFDDQPAARASLVERVRGNLQQFVAAGLLPAAHVPDILGRLTVCTAAADAVAGTRLVTEAVWEDLPCKQELLAGIEDQVPADTILASNSSAFPISQSGVRLRRPERALVTHWFNPPHLVPLVEVVPGPRTSEAVTQETLALLRGIGKQAIRLRKELPGFLINRIQVALKREVWHLLDQGVADVADIDAAVRASIGFRLPFQGPLEVYDFGGLDIQAATFRNLVPHLCSDTEVPAAVRGLIEQGHLGFKTGRGFHDYPPGVAEQRRARRDRLLLALTRLLAEHDREGGVP